MKTLPETVGFLFVLLSGSFWAMPDDMPAHKGNKTAAKPDSEKRTHVAPIKVSLPKARKQMLREKAKAAGMSMSAYLDACLDGEVPPPKEKKAKPAPVPANAPDTAENTAQEAPGLPRKAEEPPVEVIPQGSESNDLQGDIAKLAAAAGKTPEEWIAEKLGRVVITAKEAGTPDPVKHRVVEIQPGDPIPRRREPEIIRKDPELDAMEGTPGGEPCKKCGRGTHFLRPSKGGFPPKWHLKCPSCGHHQLGKPPKDRMPPEEQGFISSVYGGL